MANRCVRTSSIRKCFDLTSKLPLPVTCALESQTRTRHRYLITDCHIKDIIRPTFGCLSLISQRSCSRGDGRPNNHSAGHSYVSGVLEVALPDPTEYALATIARILERSEPRRGAERAPAEQASGEQAAKAAPGKFADDTPAGPSASVPAILPSEASPPPAEADGYSKAGPGPIAAIRVRWTVRRADNGEYFVDEIVGEQSGRRTSGPMARDAAIKLVDYREAETRQRFEQLRGEMKDRIAPDAGRGSA
jgi:hypothetical protein